MGVRRHKAGEGRSVYASIAIVVASVALATLVRWSLQGWIDTSSPVALYMLAVFVSAIYGGVWTGIACTALSVLVMDYLFLEPRYQLGVYGAADHVRVLIFAISGLGASILAEMMHRAQRKERQTGRDLRRTLELLGHANVIVRDLDDRIIGWAAGCEELYGYTAQQALGKSADELLQTRFTSSLEPATVMPLSEGDKSLEKAKSQLLAKGEWSGEVSQTRCDGGEIIVLTHWFLHRDSRGEPSAVVAVNTDITRQKLAEAELRLSREAQRAILNSAYDAILLQRADGTIIDVNDRMLEMYGLTREAAHSATLASLSSSKAPVDRLPAVWQAVLAGETRMFHWVAKRPGDGKEFAADVYLRKIDLDGEACVMASVRDMTTQRLAEQAMRRARDIAEDASRAKDNFLAMLSHELRTPLTPILAAASAIEVDEAAPAAMRQEAQTIRRNTELEKRLIDDMLDLTRVVRGKLEIEHKPVDICSVAEEAVHVCSMDADAKGVRLTADLHPQQYVMGDAARLQQVFWNLINNAIKFTPGGGRVHVSSGDLPHERVCLAVEDTGVGIDPAALERIFNAFEQAEQGKTRHFGGLGLGLAICKAIVSLHKGAIYASSGGHGKGARFTVELNRTSDRPAAPHPTAPREPLGKLRILLVEDHPDTARILGQLLRREGHQVVTAGSVSDAIDTANKAPFDILVSDLGLPDGSGLQVMQALRPRGLKGIALSGYGMEEDVKRSHDAGFAEHLTKPVNISRLTEVLEQVAHS